MKKILLGALSLAAAATLSVPATAADMRMPTKAPMMAPAMSWTGLYLGVNAGGAWNNVDSSVTDVFQTFAFPVQRFSGDDSSFVGGGHVGYNWQFSPTLLAGLEADWTWANLNATNIRSPIPTAGAPIAGGSFVSSSAKIDWLASLRARLGAVFDPQWMGYVTGGVAFADINFSGDAQCNPAVCAPGSRSPVSNSDTKFGWVIGAGLEYRLTANWLLGAEYLFYRFDGETLTSPLRNFTTGAPAGFGACAVGAACIAYNWSDMDIHVVRARLSYKF